jgi:hypothetical protein
MNVKNGASLNHYPVLKQFIPSAGMQIQAESVSAHGSSVIFNADGFDPIYWDTKPEVIVERRRAQLRGLASGVFGVSQVSQRGRPRTAATVKCTTPTVNWPSRPPTPPSTATTTNWEPKTQCATPTYMSIKLIYRY